jgi:hypothetical protein
MDWTGEGEWEETGWRGGEENLEGKAKEEEGGQSQSF